MEVEKIVVTKGKEGRKRGRIRKVSHKSLDLNSNKKFFMLLLNI